MYIISLSKQYYNCMNIFICPVLPMFLDAVASLAPTPVSQLGPFSDSWRW